MSAPGWNPFGPDETAASWVEMGSVLAAGEPRAASEEPLSLSDDFKGFLWEVYGNSWDFYVGFFILFNFIGNFHVIL